MKLRVVVFFALFFSQMHAFDALQSHILGVLFIRAILRVLILNVH